MFQSTSSLQQNDVKINNEPDWYDVATSLCKLLLTVEDPQIGERIEAAMYTPEGAPRPVLWQVINLHGWCAYYNITLPADERELAI